MCFSPEASFAVGGALLPAGVYCTQAAVRRDRRFLPLALVPVAFCIQQITEGFVWLGLYADDAALVERSSVVFLLIAIAFWPIWIPLCLAIAESRRPQRIALASLATAGLAWLWLYWPLAVDPPKWLTTQIIGHSIRYEVGELPGFALLPRAIWRLGYLLIISGSLAMGRFDPGGSPAANVNGGLLIAALFALAYGLYWQTFLSVWCFFAAVVSLLLCTAFYRLPVRGAERLEPAAAP